MSVAAAAPAILSTPASGGAPSDGVASPDGEIVPLTSTSEVYLPPRGDGAMKFSFDFPEPSVRFGGYRIGVLVFTDENTYGLDRERMRVEGPTSGAIKITCDRLVWAGGQATAPGRVTINLSPAGLTAVECDVHVEMERPVKAVTTVIRGVPRGKLALGGGSPYDPGDNEVLAAYPFGGGDLHGPGAGISLMTPLAAVVPAEGPVFSIRSEDHRVRPKRFFFQPGAQGYRVEAVYEHDAWRNDKAVSVPRWTVQVTDTLEAAERAHFSHIAASYGLRFMESRSDLPTWVHQLQLVVTLHGQHYTGFIFNDYAGQLEILRWIATQMDPARALIFLAAWDGRYYWDYPRYEPDPRMGGEAGFRRLITEARALGFHMMPMFGTNAANRKLAGWERYQGGATAKLDGDVYNLNWVDWNNDRHQDGWLAYMNLADERWRTHLAGRIEHVIRTYGVDAYFLDIVGGHVNATNGDMHEGTRRLVTDLRGRHPEVLCVGEMPYDALHGFIGMYQAGGGARWRRYSKYFSHLSAPAPGRGSSGVHEAGFGQFDDVTLGLRPEILPTLQVVEDTFTAHRDTMAEIIRRARARD